MADLRAVLFDKDGTLIDFHRTWDIATGRALRHAAPDDAALVEAAALLHFDLDTDTIGPGSPFIAEANDTIIALLEPVIDVDVFTQAAVAASVDTVAAADGLPEVLHELRAEGIELAVATNDWESIVGAQLRTLGWSELFAHVVASDSGFGAKPEPGMIHGALGLLGVAPNEALMVGDTGHDIEAGAAAGVTTALVTNNTAPDPGVAALADVVVASLRDLRSAVATAGLF